MQQAINRILNLALLAVWLVIISETVIAQTSQFTYQGKLSDSGTPATGNFDLQFKLFDSASLGTQQGSTLTLSSVAVTAGIFTVSLDFGAGVFSGPSRFLEISVRPAGGGMFTLLSPRQPLTSTPYSINSLNAAIADGLSLACVNCVTSSQISSVAGSQIIGAIPVASVPAGSSSYVQNSTTQQASANFNVSGDGAANAFTAGTQYNISSNRVLTVNGLNFTNTFVGVFAGKLDPSGNFNSFFGNGSGQSTTAGANNSFFGSGSGLANDSGSDNAFFGRSSGFANTGSQNSFFGSFAGTANSTAGQNAFFGFEAGRNNTTGSTNSFFGSGSGSSNTTGAANSFFGHGSGAANTTGTFNSFFGRGSGAANTTGGSNSFFGQFSGGANTSGARNSFFGASSGTLTTTGTDNSFFGSSAGLLNTTGIENSFFGRQSGNSNNSGFRNSFFGTGSGANNTGGTNNTFVGSFSGFSNILESNNTFIGASADGAPNVTNATALGYQAAVSQSNSLVLGSISGVNGATADTKIGIGTTSPVSRLQVVTANDTTPAFIAAWDSRHMVVGNGASSGGIGMSYDQTNNVGYFGTLHPGVAWGNLIFQSGGGNVGIGTDTNPPHAKLQVAGGSIYITQPNSLIITSPNGACWFITVNNAGALSTISIPCP